MAIYRQVASTFWTDTKVADDFNPDDRYLMLYLLTNAHTNLCGCYEVSLRQMSIDTGLTKSQVESTIKRLIETHNVIRYSPETKEVLILNWYKYNWTSSEKFRKPLKSFIMAVKLPAFREYLLDLFNRTEDEEISYPGYGIDTVSDEGRYPIDTSVSVSVSDTVSDSVSVSEKKTKPKTQLDILEETNMPVDVKEKVKDWLRYKAERHNKYQETGLKTLLNKIQRNVDENGASAVIDAIDLSISNGYAGIVWDRIRPSPSQRAAPGSDDDPLMKIIRGET